MRFLLLLSLAAIGLFGFKAGNAVYDKQDPVVRFWTWFQLNEKRLRNYDTDPEKYFTEIHQQLQKAAPGLGLEAKPIKNNMRQVTFTANGNEDIFYAVEEVVKKAPTLPGWRFIAFRQRVPAAEAQNLVMEAGDINLEVKEMKFFPVVENDSLDVIVYAEGVSDDNYMEVAYHALILLDNLLGEYDCVKKVRNYDFHAMPKNKDDLEDLKPLIELPQFVDAFTKRRNR